MFENTNEFTQRRVEANYRQSFCHKVIYFFICECLVLLFDFLQSDWLQEQAAFYEILTVLQNDKPKSEDYFQVQKLPKRLQNPPYRPSR